MIAEEHMKFKTEKNIKSLFGVIDSENEAICFLHKVIRKYAKKKSIMLWPCFGLSPNTTKMKKSQQKKEGRITPITKGNGRKDVIMDKASKDNLDEVEEIQLRITSNKVSKEVEVDEKPISETVLKEDIDILQTPNDTETDADFSPLESPKESPVKDLINKLKSNKSKQKDRCFYSCFICNEKQDSMSETVTHICTHRGIELSCRLCKMTFRSKTHYELHVLLGDCKKSNQEYKGKYHAFKDFQANINLKDIIICPYCGLRFKKSFNLQQHLKNLICKPKPLDTDIRCIHRCKLGFKSKEELAKHVKSVHSHECRICKKIFPTVRDLNSHFSTHKRIHKCDLCNEEFSKRELLRLHKKSNHLLKKEKVTHKCGKCPSVFSRKFLLQRHIYKQHPEDDSPPVFACDKCPTILKTQGSFNDHLKLHNERPSYFCSVCDRGFKVKMFLKRHLLKHTTTKDHDCDQCNSNFKRKDHLRRHIRVMHEGQRGNVKSKSKITPRINEPTTGQTASTPSQNEEQFFSLIDVQSGEMFTVPASDYTYNLIFKEQNKVAQPIISNAEPMAWSDNNYNTNTQLPITTNEQFPFLPAPPKPDTFPIYAAENSEMCLPTIPEANNITNMNLMPQPFTQTIMPEQNYSECSSNSNIVVLTNVSNLLCMPEVVVNNTNIP